MEGREVDRRGFLRAGAAGAALVLGLPELVRAEEAWEEQAWRAALAEMKARGAHGVAVVLPEGAEARRALAHALEARIPLPPHEGAELAPLAPWLLECVWVLASAARAQAQAGETLVLLDPQGKRVAGAAVPLGDPAAFERGVEALLTGEGRLEARAQAATTPEVAAALRQMDEAQGPAAVEALGPHQERATSALVRAWRSGSAEQKTWCGSLLSSAYWRRMSQPRGLPFGIEWKVERTVPEPCPPCGMAMPTFEGRKFLRFTGE